MKRDLLISIGLANLMLLFAWGNFVYPNSEALKNATHFGAANISMLLCVLFWSLILIGYRRAVRRWANKSVEDYLLAASYLALIFPLNYLRVLSNVSVHFNVISYQFWSERPILFLCVLASVGLFVYKLGRGLDKRSFEKIDKAVVVFILPIAFVTLSQSVVSLARMVVLKPTALIHSLISLAGVIPSNTDFIQKRKVTKLKPVLTLLFDELAWGVIDPKTRPTYLQNKLPSIDRLLSESFVAEEALSPGTRTVDVIPKYFASPHSNEKGNFFGALATEGGRSNVVGWFFPYCSTFGESLHACSKVGGIPFRFSPRVMQNIQYLIPRSINLQSGTGPVNYSSILKEVDRQLVEGDWDVLHTHWPIPHLPLVYEPDTDHLVDSKDLSQISYLKNILLVDKTVAHIRRKLEETNLWSKVTVVIVSDHAIHDYRDWAGESAMAHDRRIPLVIHFPGQKKSYEHPLPTTTGRLPEILNHLLHNETNAPAFAHWLANQQSMERVDTKKP